MKQSNHFNSISYADKHTKGAKQLVGKLRITTSECNYKKINRQLKGQFIHGLNDNDMSIEIIKELTKIEENDKVTSE